MQAYAAYSLLQQPPRRVGFASGCQAFGHHELLGVLRSFGLVSSPVLTDPGLSRTDMRLHDYLDKGASLGADRPCLTTDGTSMSYADVVGLSHEVAAALAGRGLATAARVAILSANDPVAFTCVFGISRAGGVWCPINPRNEAAENRELLELFGAEVVLYQSGFAPLVAAIRDQLPGVHTWVCLDAADDRDRLTWQDFLDRGTSARGARSPRTPRCRRTSNARRHRGHHRSAQGRDAHADQPRDDDGADPDGLPVRRPAGLPRARAADPRGRACCASRCCRSAARS